MLTLAAIPAPQRATRPTLRLRANYHANFGCVALADRSRWIWHRWPKKTEDNSKMPFAPRSARMLLKPHWSAGLRLDITNCNASAIAFLWRCRSELSDL